MTRDERDPDSSRLLVPGILGLAFALRATMAVRTSAIFEDGPYFLDIARLFGSGDWAGALSHPYHPLYSGLTAIANSVVHDWEAAALAVSVIGGTVSVLALYVFLRDAFDARIATFGAFLFAISPYAVRFTSDVESEGVYLAFFVTALALLWRGLGRDLDTAGPGLFLAAGLSAGLAYLTRPEGAGLVLIGAGLLALKWRRGDWQSGRVVRAGAGLVAGAAVVAAPYLWVLAGRPGGLMFSGKKSVMRILGFSGAASGPPATDLANLPLLGLVFFTVIGLLMFAILRLRTSRPGRPRGGMGVRLAIGLVLLVGWQLLWPGELEEFASVVISTLRPEVAVLVALGLYAASTRESQPRDAFVAVILVFYGALLIGLLFNYGYLSRRHVLPLVPLVLGYAGMGAIWLVDRVCRGRPRLAKAFAPAGVLAGLACVMLGIAAPKALHDHREDVLAQRLAAEWLRDPALRPGPVASNKRRAGYYAGRRWFPLTEGSELRSLDSLLRERVRYIVVDDRVLGYRDQMFATPGFDLRELHRVAVGGRTAMVYELARAATTAATPGDVGIAAGPPDHEIR